MVMPLFISSLVVLFFSWYYFIYRAFPVSLSFINAIAAFSGTFLITASFILGPLARLLPFIKGEIAYRKSFGLYGYGLVSLHVLLSVFVMLGEDRAIALADVGSLAFAAIAFVIFTMMALTSTASWLKTLGYDNWKALQRTGYVALIAVLAHVALIESGKVLTRQTGMAVTVFIMAALLLKIITMLLGMHKDKNVSGKELDEQIINVG